MRSHEYDKELDNEGPKEWKIRAAVINLTNHSLYGKLCNWHDIEFIFNSTLLDHKLPGNYISRLYHLYLLYKAGLGKANVYYYNNIMIEYKKLIQMKEHKIYIDIVLNSLINKLDSDVISVIKDFHTLLFL